MYDILQQILYFFGHGFCHQYTERSLEAGGLYFCVCARCTGIYLGFIVSLTLVVIMHYRPSSTTCSGMPTTWVIVVCAFLIVPMAIDGAGSYLGLFETTNLARYITGYLCGMSLAVISSGGILSLFPRANHRANQSQSAIRTPGRLLVLLLSSAAGGALFFLGYPSMGIVAPLISLACLWFSVTVVVLLIVSTTRLWPTSSSAPRRLATTALCLLAALAIMAVFSFAASLLGILFPWYMHP